MDWSEEENSFGQRLPPLYVEIKEVLKEYPDGQVFKVATSFTYCMILRHAAYDMYRAHGGLLYSPRNLP